jgi:hypothetical protein
MLLLYNMKDGHAAMYTLLVYDIKWGHAAIYLLLLHYMKCRGPVYVIATHIKCRQVVVYMLVLYYINCVAIYALLLCMSRGILLFICYCYTMYSVNMLPFICYCYSVDIHPFRFFLILTKMFSGRNILLILAPVYPSGCRI